MKVKLSERTQDPRLVDAERDIRFLVDRLRRTEDGVDILQERFNSLVEYLGVEYAGPTTSKGGYKRKAKG